MPTKPKNARKGNRKPTVAATTPSQKALVAAGFRLGTKTANAMLMYMRQGGATTQQVIKELHGPYLNCLSKAKASGWVVTKTFKAGPNGRAVTTYHAKPGSKGGAKRQRRAKAKATAKPAAPAQASQPTPEATQDAGQ